VRWAAVCGAALSAASLILVVMLARQITRKSGRLRQSSADISQEAGKPIVTGPPKVMWRATQSWPLWIRLTTTVAALGATFMLQLPLEQQVPGQPFLPFFVVVIATTLAFGPGIGFLSVGLSTLLSVPSFEPLGALATLTHPADVIKIELYALLSAACVVAFANFGDALIQASDESESLRRLAEKKSILLSELAHGVANNFAAVAAFISLKATSVSDTTARAVLDEAIEQVKVMGRVHRQLRGGDQDASVDSRTLIRGLCADLQTSLLRSQPHAIECEADSRLLCMDQAVLLGLIVNELVTNAIKHAFPDGRAGRIHVGFEVREGQFRLSVTDNGIGFRDRDRSNSGTGQDLLWGLSHELGGEPEIKSTRNGTSFRLSIPYVSPLPSSGASYATVA
jgi:two-component sensor histidine kinase